MRGSRHACGKRETTLTANGGKGGKTSAERKAEVILKRNNTDPAGGEKNDLRVRGRKKRDVLHSDQVLQKEKREYSADSAPKEGGKGKRTNSSL